jgi:hypothetical protein
MRRLGEEEHAAGRILYHYTGIYYPRGGGVLNPCPPKQLKLAGNTMHVWPQQTRRTPAVGKTSGMSLGRSASHTRMERALELLHPAACSTGWDGMGWDGAA